MIQNIDFIEKHNLKHTAMNYGIKYAYNKFEIEGTTFFSIRRNCKTKDLAVNVIIANNLVTMVAANGEMVCFEQREYDNLEEFINNITTTNCKTTFDEKGMLVDKIIYSFIIIYENILKRFL